MGSGLEGEGGKRPGPATLRRSAYGTQPTNSPVCLVFPDCLIVVPIGSDRLVSTLAANRPSQCRQDRMDQDQQSWTDVLQLVNL